MKKYIRKYKVGRNLTEPALIFITHAGKQIEGEVLTGLLLFFFLLFVTELEHHLTGISRTLGIQPVVAPTPRTLNERV